MTAGYELSQCEIQVKCKTQEFKKDHTHVDLITRHQLLPQFHAFLIDLHLSVANSLQQVTTCIYLFLDTSFENCFETRLEAANAELADLIEEFRNLTQILAPVDCPGRTYINKQM